MGCDKDEVKIARSKRGDIRGPPPAYQGDVFALLVFLAGRVRLGCEAGERNSSLVVDVRDALVVAAGINNVIGKHDVPVRAEVEQNLRQVGDIVAYLNNGDEIELSDNLGNEVKGGFLARALAELADIPGCQIQRFIEL